MSCDDWISVLPGDPDSHFRLTDCGCGSDHTAYVQRTDGSWMVRCFDCGREGSPAKTRHGAQGLWNRGDRDG